MIISGGTSASWTNRFKSSVDLDIGGVTLTVERATAEDLCRDIDKCLYSDVGLTYEQSQKVMGDAYAVLDKMLNHLRYEELTEDEVADLIVEGGKVQDDVGKFN